MNLTAPQSRALGSVLRDLAPDADDIDLRQYAEIVEISAWGQPYSDRGQRYRPLILRAQISPAGHVRHDEITSADAA